MNSLSDGLALLLRIGLALQRADEAVGLRRHGRAGCCSGRGTSRPLRAASFFLQQPVVDEDAGQPLADRLVDQHGGDGGIDAARQAADDAAVADLRADRGDRLVLVGGHGPVGLDAGDVVHEIGKQPGAVRRVHDLGVEHEAVHLAGGIAEDREGRALRAAENLKALRQRDDPVAVAHPDLVALAGRPQALEQRALLLDLDEGAAELAVVGALGLAAELDAHGHLPVADAEHRDAGLEHDLRRARAAGLMGRRRPARQDHRLRLDALERRLGLLERHDLGIDAGFAHAPGDQLGDLAAEIDDEDGVGMSGAFHGGRVEKEVSRRNGLARAFCHRDSATSCSDSFR